MKKLAITMGDPGGVGPEIIAKALKSPALKNSCIPIVIGDASVIEEALKLCEEVRRVNRNNWLSAGRWQCWGCVKFTKGNPEKMCLKTPDGYDGCALVNSRYAKPEHQQ